jgi:hypothetical protein
MRIIPKRQTNCSNNFRNSDLNSFDEILIISYAPSINLLKRVRPRKRAIVVLLYKTERIITYKTRGTSGNRMLPSAGLLRPTHSHNDRNDRSWFSLYVSLVDNFIEVSPNENYLKYVLVHDDFASIGYERIEHDEWITFIKISFARQ